MLSSAANIASPQRQAMSAFLTAFADPPWRITAGVTEREFAVKKLPELSRWIEAQQELKRNVSVALPAAGKRVWHLAVRVPSNKPIRCKLPSSLAITSDCYWLLWRLNEAVEVAVARKLSERLAMEIGEGAVPAMSEAVPLPGTVRFAQGGGLARNANVYLVRSLPTAYRILNEELTDDGAKPVEAPFKRADQMKVRSVEWLWPGFLPIGSLSLLGGAAGMGKSTMAAALAGIVSGGFKWPTGEKCEAGSVLVLEGEDDLERTVMPRLLAAGADMKRIGLGKAVELRESADLLEEEARQRPDLRLVVLSPVRAFFGSAELHGNLGVRAALDPLLSWAESRRVAVLGIIHPEKGKEHKEAFAGSTAFVEVARAAFSLIPDPADKNPIVKQKRRLFVVAKNNLGADNVTLRYRLDGTAVNGVHTSRVVWG